MRNMKLWKCTNCTNNRWGKTHAQTNEHTLSHVSPHAPWKEPLLPLHLHNQETILFAHYSENSRKIDPAPSAHQPIHQCSNSLHEQDYWYIEFGKTAPPSPHLPDNSPSIPIHCCHPKHDLFALTTSLRPSKTIRSAALHPQIKPSSQDQRFRLFSDPYHNPHQN